MNRQITSTESETVVLKNPNKIPGPDSFTVKVYQIFGKQETSILLKLFQKTAKEETLPNSFHVATITMIPKPDKDTTKKKIRGQDH